MLLLLVALLYALNVGANIYRRRESIAAGRRHAAAYARLHRCLFGLDGVSGIAGRVRALEASAAGPAPAGESDPAADHLAAIEASADALADGLVGAELDAGPTPAEVVDDVLARVRALFEARNPGHALVTVGASATVATSIPGVFFRDEICATVSPDEGSE